MAWNAFLIGIILKKQLFKEPAILLLFHLAFTDLLLSVVFLPFIIIPALAGEYIFGSSDRLRFQVCQTGIMLPILLLVAVNNVALLSLDRFLYIKFPLSSDNHLSFFWTLSLAFSLLLLKPGVIYINVFLACAAGFFHGRRGVLSYRGAFVGASCVIPLSILFVTNTWMLCIMGKNISIEAIIEKFSIILDLVIDSLSVCS